MDNLRRLRATTASPPAASVPTAGSEQIRVVIVDDCADVRFLLATVIELDGRFEVVAEAGDATSALASVVAADPDLVLIDLHLPGGDGLSVIRDLHEWDATACIVVVTGSATSDDCAAALDAGAHAIQSKCSMTSTMVNELAALVSVHVANVGGPVSAADDAPSPIKLSSRRTPDVLVGA